MMFQDRFPTASGSKDKKEKKVVPWQNQRKQNYNYDKTKTPPRFIKHAGCSPYEKHSDWHGEQK